MRAALVLRLCCLFTVMAVGWAQSVAIDNTKVSGASGSDIVTTVIDRIEEACIFPENKGFPRRVAWVVSRDGQKSNTFRPNFHGGIWAVTQDQFDLTKSTSLSVLHTKISTHFSITWSNVNWALCRKPLHSALAFMLYIESQNLIIPRGIGPQSTFYNTNCQPSIPAATFVADVASLYTNCNSRADIIFVLDASGSVGSTNFQRTLKFAQDVIDGFDIATDKNQIGVIRFSSSVTVSLALGYSSDKATIKNDVSNIIYTRGGTATYLAIDAVQAEFLLNGRQNAAKVAIFITDGKSGSGTMTTSRANDMHAKGIITSFAVGVGTNLRTSELEAIASSPTCRHLYYITNFFAFESIREAIEKRACEAPVFIEDETDYEVGSGETRTCKLNIKLVGITVKVTTTVSSVIYYVGETRNPGPNLNTYSLTVEVGVTAVLVIGNSGIAKKAYCSVRGGGVATNVTVHVDDGNTDFCSMASNTCPSDKKCVDNIDHFVCADPCSPNPCNQHGSCAASNHVAVCSCNTGWQGTWCDVATPNPCIPNPCANSGQCSASSDLLSYTCACASGWTGSCCHTSLYCDPDPCLNGGSCMELASGYRCTCPDGYTGVNCETANPCLPNPCVHGRCYSIGTAYYCQCPNEWTGTHCVTYNGCSRTDLNLCKNGATCNNINGGGFSCTCPSGYSGDYCQFKDSGYNCTDNPNVCSWAGVAFGFHFPSEEVDHFIQCDEGGQCENMPCSNGTSWNVVADTCVDMSCTKEPFIWHNPCYSPRAARTRFPVTHDPNKYVKCTDKSAKTCKSYTCADGDWSTDSTDCTDDAATTTQAYNCGNNNPCGATGAAQYYAHSSTNKFIQCSHGKCDTMTCTGSLVWDQAITNCNWP